MARINTRITRYEAPEGFVYDYKIIPEDGTHLYAKYLALSKSDNIDNYILVEDKRGE